MMRNYEPFNRKKPKKIGRWILAALAATYISLVTVNSVKLNEALKTPENKFEEFVKKQYPSKKKEWNEEYGENVTTLTFEKGVIKSFLDERDAYVESNKGTGNVEWHIKQDKVGEPYYVRKSGTSVVWNPFAKHTSYNEFKEQYQKNKLETIVEDI